MSDDTVYLTQKRIDELKKERAELIEKHIPEVASRINSAKELGDLSENFEYHEAKERMAFAQGRLQEIDAMLNRAVVYSEHTKRDNVGLGSKVVVSREGVEKEFVVVGAQEANPAVGKISNESPLGIACMGKRVGDNATVTTPKGYAVYTIVRIE